MSYADLRYRETCRRILREGVWDTGQEVRPHWGDGTPAHTVKLFGVVERYDLQKEFPIMTLRRTAFHTCIDELLWIWQKKSNRVSELGSHIWDSWADENGTIGKAYGISSALPMPIQRECLIRSTAFCSTSSIIRPAAAF